MRLIELLIAASLAISGVASSAPAAEAPPAPAPTVAQAATTAPAVSKTVVFVVENHSLAQMKAGLPSVYKLAQTYGYATDYRATTHPSLPNYLAMVSGSTLGVKDDKGPSAHKLYARTIFTQATQAGKSIRVYADAMPSNCSGANAGTYAVRHNVWTYFPNDRASCKKYDLPMSAFAPAVKAGKLPSVSYVIPDLKHDAHDATLATADRWIGARIKELQAGPDWQSGKLAIVITADEDDRKSGNRVLTVVASKGQPKRVVTKTLTHYSLLRFTEDVMGVGHLKNAATAPNLASAFGVKLAN